MTVTAIPTWFGPADESLFGCFHLPADGRVRGGVVICPPLAQELTRTQAAVRALAVSLAQRGLLVLRFHYLGTGDSAGESAGTGTVERWLRSIVTAHDVLVGHGIDQVALVGLRTGALLASNAVERLPAVRAVALWDPVSSGRRFIRQEQALYTLSVHPSEQEVDGVVEGVGISFDPELQADLRRLKLALPGADRALPTAIFPPAVTADAAPTRDDVEVLAIPGSYDDGPSDVSFFAGRLPTTAIRMISDWVDGHLPVAVLDAPVTVQPRDTAAVVVDGRTVRETLVAVPRAPEPGWVHAVVSEPVEGAGAARARPAALLLNISVTGRTGPTRGWVSTARRVAANGTTAVRYDRYGLGESIDDAVGYVAKDFDTDAVHDVGVVAGFLRPEDPGNVALAGLCSGAWAAAAAARELGPRELVLMNVNLLAWRATPLDAEHARSTGVEWVLEPDPRRPPTRAARLVQEVRDRWRRFPLPLAAGLGLVHLPRAVLDSLPPETARVSLLLCEEDHEEFVALGGPTAVARRDHDPAIELVTVPFADHGLIGRQGRDLMLAELVDRLCRS